VQHAPVAVFFAVGKAQVRPLQAVAREVLPGAGQHQRLRAAGVQRLHRAPGQAQAADFSQQHVADQKLPAADKCAYTVVLGMRSWLFAPFRELLRPAA
jgi:hypothetical protein